MHYRRSRRFPPPVFSLCVPTVLLSPARTLGRVQFPYYYYREREKWSLLVSFASARHAVLCYSRDTNREISPDKLIYFSSEQPFAVVQLNVRTRAISRERDRESCHLKDTPSINRNNCARKIPVSGPVTARCSR